MVELTRFQKGSAMNNETPSSKNAAQVALELFNILEPLPPDLRKRAIQSALASLGESFSAAPNFGHAPDGANLVGDMSDTQLGPKARKWCQRNNFTMSQLEEVFHFGEDKVEVTANEISGNSKKDKTVNCYLLEGIRGLLQSDEPKVDDGAAIALCKRLAAYDKNNHTSFRKSVGNRMTGDKSIQVLTGPGEKAAAELVKQMVGPS